LTGLAIAPELGDEIAQRTVGETELASDIRQRTPVYKEGTQGLKTAVLRLARFEEKLLTAQVFHDQPSKVSWLFLGDGEENGNEKTACQARGKTGHACQPSKIRGKRP
jgi:hypothetical protein